jgi:hypothetical protein
VLPEQIHKQGKQVITYFIKNRREINIDTPRKQRKINISLAFIFLVFAYVISERRVGFGAFYVDSRKDYIGTVRSTGSSTSSPSSENRVKVF